MGLGNVDWEGFALPDFRLEDLGLNKDQKEVCKRGVSEEDNVHPIELVAVDQCQNNDNGYHKCLSS